MLAIEAERKKRAKKKGLEEITEGDDEDEEEKKEQDADGQSEEPKSEAGPG